METECNFTARSGFPRHHSLSLLMASMSVPFLSGVGVVMNTNSNGAGTGTFCMWGGDDRPIRLL